jgi:hypothetical protein
MVSKLSRNVCQRALGSPRVEDVFTTPFEEGLIKLDATAGTKGAFPAIDEHATARSCGVAGVSIGFGGSEFDALVHRARLSDLVASAVMS